MTEAENKYNFPFELSEESIKALENYGVTARQALETVAEITKKLAEALKPVIETIVSIWEQLAKEVIKVHRAVIEYYPNKRIIHLATHGKRRTRKKNINKILKWFMRWSKNNAQTSQN